VFARGVKKEGKFSFFFAWRAIKDLEFRISKYIQIFPVLKRLDQLLQDSSLSDARSSYIHVARRRATRMRAVQIKKRTQLLSAVP
jgi:hypothetical protein